MKIINNIQSQIHLLKHSYFINNENDKDAVYAPFYSFKYEKNKVYETHS